MKNKLRFTGIWDWEKVRKGRVLQKGRIHNLVLDAGLNDILSVYFANGTQKPNWYLGLVDNVNFNQIQSSDTAASHAGWQENTGYSGSTRVSWNPSVGGNTAANASAQVFTFTTGVSLAGLMVISNSTKGGTSGILWSAAQFGEPTAFQSGDVLRVSYNLSVAGGG